MNFKKNQKVIDSWYPDWGTGTVKEVKKTRLHIDFTIKGLVVYDKPHAIRFLLKKTK